MPFVLMWALVVLINAPDVGVWLALRSGVVGMGTAAVLGQVVWWATGRIAWPDPVRPGFVLVHVALATAYALIWLLGVELVFWVVAQQLADLPAGYFRFWLWENWGWRVLMGYWLYGLVAGVSYSLRIRERLREQERAAARLEALATQARLESLRARLNPHFLFNALNSVAALIPEDPRAAESAVERLAGLLRYTLAESDRPVTLADEWAFTRQYLEMERLRFGDRLTVEATLAPDALRARVPPFALQTLVENAVRHAVARRPEGATVTVRAGVADGRLTLEVEDDGPGGNGGPGGTGLANLRERLRGRYGAAAALEVAARPGDGFRVTMVVPVDGDGVG